MPLVLYNNKLLVVDGALATSLDCCCDQHVCCYCLEPQFYTSQDRGTIGLKQWGGSNFAFMDCQDCYRLQNGQIICIPLNNPQPPNSVFTTVLCGVSVSCRVADMAWAGGLPGHRPVNTGDDNLIGDPWVRGSKRSVCDEDVNEAECVQCRALVEDENGLIVGFLDRCGNFAKGRKCKNPPSQPWDQCQANINCCSDPL